MEDRRWTFVTLLMFAVTMFTYFLFYVFSLGDDRPLGPWTLLDPVGVGDMSLDELGYVESEQRARFPDGTVGISASFLVGDFSTLDSGGRPRKLSNVRARTTMYIPDGSSNATGAWREVGYGLVTAGGDDSELHTIARDVGIPVIAHWLDPSDVAAPLGYGGSLAAVKGRSPEAMRLRYPCNASCYPACTTGGSTWRRGRNGEPADDVGDALRWGNFASFLAWAALKATTVLQRITSVELGLNGAINCPMYVGGGVRGEGVGEGWVSG